MKEELLKELQKTDPDKAVWYKIAFDLHSLLEENKELRETHSQSWSTLKEIVSQLDNLNSKELPVFPDEVKVKNLGDINIPDNINIKEPDWLNSLKTEELPLILEVLNLIRKNGIKAKIDTDARKPLAVRLTNGQRFYNSIMTAVASGGGSPFENTAGKSDNALIDYRRRQVVINADEQLDAFSRLRVSNPQTLFDSKNIFNDDGLETTVENQPLFYDNQETSGGGTATAYNANKASQTLSVSASTAGTRVRQTKMRFNYQPAKSQLVFMTYNLDGLDAGITKREGIFDDSNGIFLEAIGTTVSLVIRSNATGTPVNTKVAQADWNRDPLNGTGVSRINLDFTKTQILMIDYEWLGVGRTRVGFVIDGVIYYAHEFNHANNLSVVYMSTPNLPLRSEISNDGTGGASTVTQICSSVISEGGSEDLGVLRYASTAGTHVDMAVENTIYAILGIRLKAEYIGATIKLINMALQVHTANHEVEWILKFNPTVAGTFTYADQTNSAVQIAKGATANTVTGGIDINGGFVESGGASTGSNGSLSSNIDNALLLGSLIDGTVDEIVLCARPIAGSTDVDIEGSLTWRELV